MIIIPAIDLKKSKVVRLYKGKFEIATSYGLNPEEIVKDFILKGARRIHIVSLLGAKEGKILDQDISVIENMVKMRNLMAPGKCTMQIGGGIRKMNEIKQMFSMGIDYVIIGTAIVLPQILEANFTISDISKAYALADKKFSVEREIPEPDLIDKINDEIKKRVIVSIDVSRTSVALSGWQVVIPIEPSWVISKLAEKNFSSFMITDTSRDGTLYGINIDVFASIIHKVRKLTTKNIEFIIGGGIGSQQDIETILQSNLPVAGIVIGKAIYEQKINLHTIIKKYQT
ncbi:MAG TPA: HisA/HisF-related TIM barrel protein [bacterium]|nr:HisA/HisF-related TIM barrel protein [bacterium]HOL34532.1 HisA/HisF-related TIM barrel protein [bacterium]HPP07518.1 HisA/HisF-related TIM barrel protein [bacterium]